MSEKKSETIQLPVNYSGKIDNSNQKPFVRTFMLDTEKKLPMVVVCPGGGYEHLSERESEPVAKKMNALGYHAMVLSYSLAPMEFPAAMCDLAEAVALVRRNADEWNVDENRIIVCGFSAGGHLAASLGCYWRSGIIQDLLPYTPEETRPNFLILC
ncbi:MAG: alpha/beta hydrolase, partial [Treponema sp.]|nr:alpha/beta hydrolase [Treponema sp.]